MIVSRAAARELEVFAHVVRGAAAASRASSPLQTVRALKPRRATVPTPCPRGHVANVCSSVRWCRYFGRPQKRARTWTGFVVCGISRCLLGFGRCS